MRKWWRLFVTKQQFSAPIKVPASGSNTATSLSSVTAALGTLGKWGGVGRTFTVAVTGNLFSTSFLRRWVIEETREKMKLFWKECCFSCWINVAMILSSLALPQRMPLTTDLFSQVGFYSRLEIPDLFTYGLKYIFSMWEQASQRKNSWLTEPFLENLISEWLNLWIWINPILENQT